MIESEVELIHPGKLIGELILKICDNDIRIFAREIDFSHEILQEIVDCKEDISFKNIILLNIKLSCAGYRSTDFWMNLWTKYFTTKVEMKIHSKEKVISNLVKSMVISYPK